MAPIVPHPGGRAIGPAGASGLSARQQWGLVATLTVVSMLAMIDKNLIQLMVDPIKADLGLTDVQISLLIGAAFAIANLAASLPAGWLADRTSRRMLIGSGVVIWSIAAAAGGLARSFGGFFAVRAAVGFGEGLIPPACYSLMRDGIDGSRRGRALAVYSMAITAGAGLALVVCGALIAAIVAQGIDRVPLIGAIRPWQLTLMAIGIAGLPVALLVLILPRVGRPSRHETGQSSYRDAIAFFRSRSPVLAPLLIYSIAHAMLMATMGTWVPALIGRRFGLAPQTLGPILGSLLILCGPGGLLLVGTAIDRLNAARRPGAAIVGIAGAVMFALAGAIMPQVGSLRAFWLVETLVLLSTTPFLVVTAEIVSREAPAHMVGKLMALFLFIQAIMGPALAPTLTALLSQHLYADHANPLGDAISTASAALGVIGIAMIALTWRNMRRRDRAMTQPAGGIPHGL